MAKISWGIVLFGVLIASVFIWSGYSDRRTYTYHLSTSQMAYQISTIVDRELTDEPESTDDAISNRTWCSMEAASAFKMAGLRDRGGQREEAMKRIEGMRWFAKDDADSAKANHWFPFPAWMSSGRDPYEDDAKIMQGVFDGLQKRTVYIYDHPEVSAGAIADAVYARCLKGGDLAE